MDGIRCIGQKGCSFYIEANEHSIDNCVEFKNEMQKLKDAKILMVSQTGAHEVKADMISNASFSREKSRRSIIYTRTTSRPL